MNRLIIIGNGFDLAHGLKTGYCDFISDYWSKVKNSFHNDEYIYFINPGPIGHNFDNCMSLKDLIQSLMMDGAEMRENNHTYISFSDGLRLEFKNKFFKILNDRHHMTNWVDIEMVYYELVKSIINMRYGQSEEAIISSMKKRISELNENIQDITNSFKHYLEQNVSSKIYYKKFDEMFKVLENPGGSFHDDGAFQDEFPKKLWKELWPPHGERRVNLGSTNKRYKETYVLNFNYTNTVNNYLSNGEIVINIHGELGCPINNNVLLGFGDEKDRFYSELEDLNDNEFLRFMKSFHYVQNDNHKRLFDFVESGRFQVQLMGHSCGLSDRTLLNAVFENHNCISIKSFYYQFQSKNRYGESDNFLELNKNISRHFSDKKVMRDKIVNKKYCKPLPQNTIHFEIT